MDVLKETARHCRATKREEVGSQRRLVRDSDSRKPTVLYDVGGRQTTARYRASRSHFEGRVETRASGYDPNGHIYAQQPFPRCPGTRC